jgi:DNA topoisomerase IB
MIVQAGRHAGLCRQTGQSSQAGRQAGHFRQASRFEQTGKRAEHVGTNGRTVQIRLAGRQGNRKQVGGRR